MFKYCDNVISYEDDTFDPDDVKKMYEFVCNPYSRTHYMRSKSKKYVLSYDYFTSSGKIMVFINEHIENHYTYSNYFLVNELKSYLEEIIKHFPDECIVDFNNVETLKEFFGYCRRSNDPFTTIYNNFIQHKNTK